MNCYVLPDPVLGTGVGGAGQGGSSSFGCRQLGLESARTAAVSHSTFQRLSILTYEMVGEHPTDFHSS